MQATKDSMRDPGDDPVLIFARRWLMPMAVVSSLLAIAAIAWALSL
jgi:hypothetical protein